MYRNILIPIDPAHEERHATAIEMATRLAEDNSATLTAVTVLEPVPRHVASQVGRGVLKKANEMAMGTLRHAVGERSEIVTKLLEGNAGVEIVEFAKNNKIDCIVVASHKPGLVDYFLGSTAARVVRHAPCSVHVLR